MKTIRFHLPAIAMLAIATMAIAIASQRTVKADMNAQAIVDQFNRASGGTEMMFSYGFRDEANVSQYGNYGFADTSGYAQGVTGGGNFFRTFCVQPNIIARDHMEATLNYENGRSSTTDGYHLTIGAAYLYSRFAAGTLDGYDYDNISSRSGSSNELLSAIRDLMGISTERWTSNEFLSRLLSITNDRNFWTQAYDPNRYYDIIGNYSVFVMNNREIGTGNDGQDFLYMAKTHSSSEVPEPATVLLWGLVGAFQAVKRRRKNKLYA